MSYFMGIDLGTSSVKVLVADEMGVTKGIGQIGYKVSTPKIGYAEQDPCVWWDCTVQAVKQALLVSGIAADEIKAIGFSGQMHGLVALDAEKKPVGMAMIHLDQRSLEEKQIIYQEAGELLETDLMNQPSAGMSICSLLWMKRNQPRLYEDVKYVMSPKDFIRFKLTGIICTDYNDASATLAYSVGQRCWCDTLLRRLDLKEDIWPVVYEADRVVGTVTSRAARETGLSGKSAVVVGTGDSAAALIGNAVVEDGILACNIGTASQLTVVTKRPVTDKDKTCQLWCHAIADTWTFSGGSLNGGNTLSWLKNKCLRDTRDFSQLDMEAKDVPAGCEGLMFLPFLSGERTPYNNPLARGVYFGLGLKHDQSYLVRATMEGVMHNLCECKRIFDEMGILQKRLISSGGAAKGITWKQIQADMLNMPVHTTQTQEEACLGAVILAAVGIDAYSNVEQACKEMVTLCQEVVEPIPENVNIYCEKQAVYRELYGGVKHLFRG